MVLALTGFAMWLGDHRKIVSKHGAEMHRDEQKESASLHDLGKSEGSFARFH